MSQFSYEDIFESDEEDEEFVSCFMNNIEEVQDTLEPDPPPDIDEEQLKSDSLKIRIPVMKELNLLDEYIHNEGNLPTQSTKCKDCIQENCKNCIKYSRSNPAQLAVIEEMKEKIVKEDKEDGTSQHSVRYVTETPLDQIFTPKVSNYHSALKQATHVFF